MERIRLSKREKAVLRILSKQGYEALSEFDASAVRSLSELGFVKAAFTEGGSVEDAKLTTKGKEYLRDYPSLRNPVDWVMAAALVSVVNTIFLILLMIITLYPVLNTLAYSFNDGTDALRGNIGLWPRVFSLESYRSILSDKAVYQAAWISAYSREVSQ